MSLGPSGVEAALRRAGRVGEDLLAVDWSAHPLGPPAGWPAALANAVRIVVTSRFSMWMAWGERLTFFCNDAYRRDTLGTKYPWALGRPASEVWEEIWPDIGPRIDRVTATGEATWDESLLLFLERSGYAEETYHTFSYSPLTGDGGEVAGMLCVVTEDTDRIVGERRMRTLRDLGTDPSVAQDEDEVLRAASRHLAANSADLPFTLAYLWDADGSARLVATSGFDAAHPAAGPVWPRDAAAQGRESVVDLVAPDGSPARPELADLPCGAWQTPPRQAVVVPLGRPGEDTPTGFLVVGLNRFRPLDESYLGFVRLVAGHLGTGVAAARAYEAERRRAEALAELDRAKTTFFTNVSHEFRTPLTLLLGPVEDALADDARPLDPVQRERLDVMRRNALRLLKLVDMLLDFSRLESGRATARFAPADLGRSTRELASMFAPAFERAGLSLDVEVLPADGAGGPGPQAWVDDEMWAKIVLNLLSNALKHTFTGGVRVTVETTDGAVAVRVADTGIGIPAVEQEHLFERFHRVLGARSRSHEGSGIGLALVAELAALHGGDVRVESEPGRGSAFTVRVPRGRAHLPPDQVADGDGAARPGERAGRRAQAAVLQAAGFLAEAERWVEPVLAVAGPPPGAATVLVVDDNADMRDYLVSLLAPSYAVMTSADGVEALEQVQERRPDLVVSDVMMPRLDGFALLKELRQDPRTADVPVVLLSARAGDEATVEGLDAGADDYLVKPFSARELLARVRSNLELDRSRRTLVELERYRLLLDQTQRLTSVGSWEIDLATRRVVLSDEFSRLLGRTAAEFQALADDPRLAGLVHPDDVDAYLAVARRAVDSGGFDVEVRLLDRDGGARPYRVMGEVVRDALGRPVRMHGSAQDVTEQHRTAQLQAAAAAEREAAAREHAIAEELQTSLLPRDWERPDHLDLATYYRAGTQGTRIGGDWFDVVGLGAGRTALVIGDVMGRGVAAAAVMAQLRAAVRAFARLDLPPADLLELLDGVVRDLGDEQIVTCVYAVYDPGDRSLTFANAGHLPPLLVTPSGRVRRLGASADPPLGAGPFTLSETSVQLPARSTLALYTDGLVEHRDADLDVGIDALATALAAQGDRAGDPARLAEALLPDGPDDDVALLVAHVGRAHPATSALVFPLEGSRQSVSRTRRLVDDVLARWDVPAGVRDDAALVVSELVTNAVLHGDPPAELRLRRGTGHVVLEVHDGASFLPRKLRPGIQDEHGRGLQIVATLAQRWGTRPTPGGKAVWCVLPVP